MDGVLLEGRGIPEAEVEQRKQELFGDDFVKVNQTWRSHGSVLSIGDWAYFKGNPNNPDDPCGTVSMSMQVSSITASGICPHDATTSYILIPID